MEEENTNSSLEEALRDFLKRKKEETQALKKLLDSLQEELEVIKSLKSKDIKDDKESQQVKTITIIN